MPSDLRYLLQLRQEADETLTASLRAVSDGALRTFTSLEEMIVFLKDQLAKEPAAEAGLAVDATAKDRGST